jgi:hypothetical protein
MTKRKIQYWVIPPEGNAEFVASMEEVLETYAQRYDERYPVVCMDEQPVQLLKETRVPVPASKTHPRRVDYEYERAGTASIFMFCEPLSGWRETRVREQRTKVDRASPGVPLHAQTWQLAEHCGERTEFANPTVPEGAATGRHRGVPRGNHVLARGQQCQAARRRLAIQNRRRAAEAEVALS